MPGPYHALVFDFDGTLAQTLELALEVFNGMARRFQIPPLTDKEVESLRGLPTSEVVRRFGGTLRCSRILKAVKEELVAHVPHMQPVEGMPCLLEELVRRQIRVGIVSSNRRDVIVNFLDRQSLTRLVSAIQAGSSLFGKARHLRKIARVLDVDPRRMLYVGDESRDIEAAREAGCDSAGVTWGANCERVLGAFSPTLLARRPDDLLSCLS